MDNAGNVRIDLLTQRLRPKTLSAQERALVLGLKGAHQSASALLSDHFWALDLKFGPPHVRLPTPAIAEM